MDFWDTVRAAIKTQDTKIEAVALEAGISLNTFNGWMSKGRLPRLDEAYKISQVLGTTVDYLISGEKSYQLRDSTTLVRECEGQYSPSSDTFPVPILNQKVAAIVGVDTRTIRKWTASAKADNRRAIPWSAWVLLQLFVDEIGLADYRMMIQG